MSLGKLGLRAIVLGGLAALMVMAFGASSAWAEPATLCVKATKVTTPKKHYTGGWNDKGCASVNATHEGKYEKIKPSLLSEPEQEELKALLQYTKVVPSGVGGKPTVQVSGANVQVLSGAGKEETVNGEGNLYIGYFNEEPGPESGSNNLIVGTRQTYTSYGSIIAGSRNTDTGPYSDVFGELNIASGTGSSVTGGGVNTASGEGSSVSGGSANTASSPGASVSGGYSNRVGGFTVESWIGGGYKNEVFDNTKSGEEGQYSAIFGGKENKTAKNYEAIP